MAGGCAQPLRKQRTRESQNNCRAKRFDGLCAHVAEQANGPEKSRQPMRAAHARPSLGSPAAEEPLFPLRRKGGGWKGQDEAAPGSAADAKFDTTLQLQSIVIDSQYDATERARFSYRNSCGPAQSPMTISITIRCSARSKRFSTWSTLTTRVTQDRWAFLVASPPTSSIQLRVSFPAASRLDERNRQTAGDVIVTELRVMCCLELPGYRLLGGSWYLLSFVRVARDSGTEREADLPNSSR